MIEISGNADTALLPYRSHQWRADFTVKYFFDNFRVKIHNKKLFDEDSIQIFCRKTYVFDVNSVKLFFSRLRLISNSFSSIMNLRLSRERWLIYSLTSTQIKTVAQPHHHQKQTSFLTSDVPPISKLSSRYLYDLFLYHILSHIFGSIFINIYIWLYVLYASV
jgi:hypothetical protein